MAMTTAGAADAGARMLQRVGDFVEPLTRFDKSHLKLVSCSEISVPIVITQTFEARFGTTTDDGNGKLPSGIRDVSSNGRLEAELETMLDRARQAGSGKLAAWSRSNGSSPEAAPRVGDLFELGGRGRFYVHLQRMRRQRPDDLQHMSRPAQDDMLRLRRFSENELLVVPGGRPEGLLDLPRFRERLPAGSRPGHKSCDRRGFDHLSARGGDL